MDLPNILKRLRAERNVSQAFMAEMLSISKQAYSNYERGVREPDYQTLCTLADYFLISLDTLLGRPSKMEQELMRRAQNEREEREFRERQEERAFQLKMVAQEKRVLLTHQEKVILRMFRALTDSEKKEVFTYLKVKTLTKVHIDEFSDEFEEEFEPNGHQLKESVTEAFDKVENDQTAQKKKLLS